MHYRHKAIFVRDPLAHSTPLDRNARKKIFLAESLERRTEAKGRKEGTLGKTGIRVLRALLFRFANIHTGLCFPSYRTLQALTGLSRGGLAAALKRLEHAGIIKITRRLKRIWIGRLSPITGHPERIMATVQTTCMPSPALRRLLGGWTAMSKHTPLPWREKLTRLRVSASS